MALSKEKRIQLLTSKWYEYIRMNHHKDRDCHWFIEKRWSYGDPAKYYPAHFGYITEEKLDGQVGYDTQEEAEEALIQYLLDQINKEYEWVQIVKKDREEEYGVDAKEQATKFLELFKEELR